MAINFRLEYTNGIEFIDLFPLSNIGVILNGSNINQTQVTLVTIPAPGGVAPSTQNVAITTNDFMLTCPFEVVLLSTGAQAEYDYGTISQMQVTANTLTITRLYTMPVAAIQVALVFNLQRGGE